MSLIIYALLVAAYWFWVAHLAPQKFPHADPKVLKGWQQKQLRHIRRYLGLYLFWVILAFSNGILLNVAYRHGQESIWHWIAQVTLFITAIFAIFTVVYTLLQVVRDLRHGFSLKILGQSQ